MREILDSLAQLAAVQAAGMLERQTFGAVDELRLELVSEHVDEGDLYFRVRWTTYSMGLPGHEVNMVVLPEYLEGDLEDLEYFQEQMAAYIVERVLELQADAAAEPL